MSFLILVFCDVSRIKKHGRGMRAKKDHVGYVRNEKIQVITQKLLI